jgi:SPW repeat
MPPHPDRCRRVFVRRQKGVAMDRVNRARRRRPGVEDPAYEARMLRTYVHWTSGMNVVLGAWLIVSPWMLGYSGAHNATWTDIGVGTCVLLVAALRVLYPEHSAALAWVNVALGAWLVAASYAIPYATGVDRTPVHWNDVLVGAGVIWFALWSLTAGSRATTR